jgi:hypothetical protein
VDFVRPEGRLLALLTGREPLEEDLSGGDAGFLPLDAVKA